jgi:asparagine synthase (glutamine-hydrolysing)
VSGIAVAVARPAAQPPSELAATILGRLPHRGPPSNATSSDRQCQLGHAAFDVAPPACPQPLRLGHVLVVADARIDNRDDLGCEGQPDAVAIATAYLRWGAEAARRLRGDFAFALWDERARRLYCARDPLGVKSLYYAERPDLVACASEPAALGAIPGFALQPDLDSVAGYIAGGYHENAETLYQGIRALPSGHQGTVANGELRVARYWQPDPFRRLPARGDEEHALLLRDALRRAVAARLRAPGAVAVMVSGGTDSASVAGQVELLRRAGVGPQEPPTVLHQTFGQLDCDETRFSRAVARRWGLPLLEVDALAPTDRTSPARAELHADLRYFPSSYSHGWLAEAARDRGMLVVLTGQGADLPLTDTGAEVADALAQQAWRRVARETGLSREPWRLRSWKRLWGLALRHHVPDALRDVVRPFRRTAPAWLSPPFARRLAQREAERRRDRRARLRFPDLVTEVQFARLESCRFHRDMALLDRVAAHSGVELRHPFLASELVELLVAMPAHQRGFTDPEKPKPVLRRAMRDALPTVVYRRIDAAEFSRHWAFELDRHAEHLRRLFDDSRLLALGVITPEAARQARSARDGPALLAFHDWTSMEIWLRHVMR